MRLITEIIKLLILMLILSLAYAEENITCGSEGEIQADQTMAQIMTYGREDIKFPVTSQELIPYCKNIKKLLGKMKRYREQCLKGRAKQVVAVINYSIKQTMKLYCRNVKSRASLEMLAGAPCANAAWREYYACGKAYIDGLFEIATWKPRKQRTQICCGYYQIPKCMRESTLAYGELCKDPLLQGNIHYVKSFFGNTAELLCANDYGEHSYRCHKVKLATLRRPPPSPYPESFFNPLVHILSNW